MALYVKLSNANQDEIWRIADEEDAEEEGRAEALRAESHAA